MPHVIFTRPYIYTPTLERRISTKFQPSPKPRLVSPDCAEKAIAAGVAIWPPEGAPTVWPRPTRARAARVRGV